MAASSAFDLLPAIDLLGGRCVRLFQGDYGAATEYATDAAAVAARWLEAGARWLHVVDLDAARSGTTQNGDAIRAIVKEATRAGARVEVGGGIRDHEAIDRWLSLGVARCVIGTQALDVEWMAQAVNRFGADCVVAGLDGRGGKVAVRGWMEQTDAGIPETAAQLAAVGVRWALVTDVERDGTLSGANLGLAQAVQAAGLRALASGGVHTLADILAARAAGLAGVVVGRALYDGTIDLAEAVRAVNQPAPRAAKGGNSHADQADHPVL
jgi:phosphoribosylformimino-5-aminoimidazole carboxamide ribotide isomerase